MRLMLRFKESSIKNQLMVINFLTVTVLMTLLCVGLVVNEFLNVRKSSIDFLAIQAKMIAKNSTAAVSFGDAREAGEMLSSLGMVSNIDYAVIYKDGEAFASYKRNKWDSKFNEKPPSREGFRFTLNSLEMNQFIILKGEILGVLTLRSDLSQMYTSFLIYTGVVFLILIGSLFSAFLLLSRFQKVITRPIFNLAGVIDLVSKGNDFTKRAKAEGGSEFVILAQGFNNMLEQIQNRENELELRRKELFLANDELHQELSRRKVAEEELREKEARLRKIFEEGPLGMVLIDLNYRLLKINDSLSKLLRQPEEAFLNKSITDIIHPDDIKRFLNGIGKLFEGSIPTLNEEIRLEIPDGSQIWINFTASIIQNQEGAPLYCIGMLENINERRKLYERLKHDALHDALTQLPNRALLMERLKNLIARVNREKDFTFSLLFLDLDRFKNINDSFGHLVGDQLLIEVGKRLKHCVRAYNTLARLGGDEFAILLEDTRNEKDGPHVADKILQELKAPFRIGGNEILLTASIGIAVNTPEYMVPEEILRDADIALYQAKSKDRNCFIIFNEGMHERVKASLKMENDLRRGIENKELILHYQPIVTIDTLELVGFESLVRWKPKGGELIPPLKFIPLAEETGLIMPLGKWCFHEACRQAAQWHKQFPFERPLSVSVNLSSKQVKAGLIDYFQEVLHQTGLRPESLGIELTESVIMENSEIAKKLIFELTEMKVKIYLDDFGTGYSSLNYLHKIQIDALKIDRSFVMGMTTDTRARGIVKTIIDMAHSLNKTVIAEGVETSEQLEQLRRLGCKYFQGYLYSKPLPANEVEAILREKVIHSNNKI
jgi:diguanylate cyclase (GGDEF)-like protein/PAS domain S-box-containing protein